MKQMKQNFVLFKDLMKGNATIIPKKQLGLAMMCFWISGFFIHYAFDCYNKMFKALKGL